MAGRAWGQIQQDVGRHGAGVDRVDPTLVAQNLSIGVRKAGELVGVDIGVVAGVGVAEEGQSPRVEAAGVAGGRIGHRQGPGPLAGLAPELHAVQGELDVVLAGATIAGLVDQHARRTVRRGQRDNQLADVGMRQVEQNLDVID